MPTSHVCSVAKSCLRKISHLAPSTGTSPAGPRGSTCKSTLTASDISWWSRVTESPMPRCASRPYATYDLGPRSGGTHSFGSLHDKFSGPSTGLVYGWNGNMRTKSA